MTRSYFLSSCPFKEIRLGLIVIIWAVFLVFFTFDAFSQTKEDERKIQIVISKQLEALAKDDWDGAFLFASPDIRKLIGTSEAFKSMIINGYPIVYRPRVVSFEKIHLFNGKPAQLVYMVGLNGKAATVVYFMINHSAGVWRINGVQLIPSKEIPA